MTTSSADITTGSRWSPRPEPGRGRPRRPEVAVVLGVEQGAVIAAKGGRRILVSVPTWIREWERAT